MANESVGSLPIDNYVVSFRTSNTDERTQLLYRVSKDDPWTVVSEGTEIPGDAMLHLDIAYDGVSVSELKAHDGRLSYTLPGFMRNANASGNILAGQDIVGTVVVNNGVAVITFKPEFLENQESNTLLGGTFFVESQLDYTYIDTQEPGSLVIGDVSIGIDFEGDLVAQYGKVDVTKEFLSTRLIQNDQGDFLEYKLTVTAGPDGATNVVLADKFTNFTYIEEYVGVTGESTAISACDSVTETGAPDGNGGSVYLGNVDIGADGKAQITQVGANAQKPGTMIWEIGNMAPNEERILLLWMMIH